MIDWKKELNAEQYQAVVHSGSHLQVVASPGSGKCVHPDTLVWNRGLRRFGDMMSSGARRIESGWGPHRITDWHDDGVRDGRLVQLECGLAVDGTDQHPVWARRPGGYEGWTLTSDLTTDDYVALGRGCADWGTEEIPDDEAYLLGLMTADASRTSGGGMQIDKQRVVLEAIIPTLLRFRGYAAGESIEDPVITDLSPDHAMVVLHGAHLADMLLDRYGYVLGAYSEHRTVPWRVLCGTRQVVRQFLRGYFDGDGYCEPGGPAVSSASAQLIGQVQLLLLGLGVYAGRRTKPTSYRKKDGRRKQCLPAHILQVRDAPEFQYEVGFTAYGLKKDRALARLLDKPRNTNSDVIPYLGKLLDAARQGQGVSAAARSAVSRYALEGKNHRAPSYQRLRYFLSILPSSAAHRELARIADEHRAWSRVRSITPIRSHRIDCTVAKRHAFIGNGIVNHNTRALTYRAAHLLLERDVPAHRILLTTFTNKAAGEIKERLNRLAGPEKMKGMWIGTFHSICVRLIRLYGQRFGINPKFQILDQGRAESLIGRVMKERKLESTDGPAYGRDISRLKDDGLWAEDEDAVRRHRLSRSGGQRDPELLLNVYRRYQQLVREHGSLDFGDLLLWGGTIARDEVVQPMLRAKFGHVLVDEAQDTNGAQYQLLTALSLGAKHEVCIVGDEDQCAPAGSMVTTTHGPIPMEQLDPKQHRVISWGRQSRAAGTSREFRIAARWYDGPLYTVQAGRRETSVTAAHRFLCRRAGTQNLLECRADDLVTGLAGMQIPIPDPPDTWASIDNVVVSHYAGLVYSLDVADDHTYIQDGLVTLNSIYGWRGADMANLMKFAREFPDVRQIVMAQNYRSTSAIVGSADRLIRHNTERYTKNIFTQNQAGTAPVVKVLEDDAAEARWVAQMILQAMQQKVPPHEIAVLYRGNQQSLALEDALRQLRVPYFVVGGFRFFDRSEIRDILSYLRLMVNPASDVDFERIINRPPRGLGDVALKRIGLHAGETGLPMPEAARQLTTGSDLTRAQREGVLGFLAVYDELRTGMLAQETPQLKQMLLEIVRTTGYRAFAMAAKDGKGRERMDNLIELAESANDRQQKRPKLTVQDWLQEISLWASDDEKTREQCCTLSTLHSSKGLEFKYVFLVGAADGIIPHQRSLDSGTIEEERRLMYVAITRAKERFFASYGLRGRSSMERAPSRFLYESGILTRKERKDGLR